MLNLRRYARLLAIVLCAGCASTAPSSPAPDTPDAQRVVLISIDAFRADYLDRGITPNLSRLARDGVRAQWMTPAYPSLTFPNHYSIVTGLRPDRHGIVHNTMRDPALGGFKIADRSAVADPRWWGGEPIWVTAQRAGITSATLFWPGSEAPISGMHPHRWLPFDKAVASAARVDTLLGWLDDPPPARARMLTLYFDMIDEAGHDHGPDSPQVNAALREVDAAIGRLRDGLAARGLLASTNLIVVSDHGMAAVAPGHRIAIEDMVSVQEAVVVTAGQAIGIVPNAGFEDVVAGKLLGAHEHYDCWRKGELPARWHYGTHRRIPPIVCQMHEGWDALPRDAIAARQSDHARGSHGYDPALPSMRALFVANGPAFKPGAVIAPFDSVDVYPLLAHLIGVPPAANDGDIASLLPALRKTAAPVRNR
ncbi:MAG: ectonucleotide pyrophosphatase/phosphodiesterase [Luteimonas sp.]